MATHTDDQKEKLVTLEGLGKYHHSMVSALGLTQDTGAYNYTYTSTDPAHTGETHTAPTTVKGAMDELYGKTMLMCDDAKKYFEAQYHSLFTSSYDHGTGSISKNPNSGFTYNGSTDAVTYTLTATFTPGNQTAYYIENGKEKSKTIATTFYNTGTAENPVYVSVPADSGWVVSSTNNGPTEVVFTKTVTKNPGTDADFSTKDLSSVSVTGTGLVYDIDPTKQVLKSTATTEFSQTLNVTWSLKSPFDFYWAELSNADYLAIKDGDTTKVKTLFDNKYKTSGTGTFSNGEFKFNMRKEEKDPVTKENLTHVIFFSKTTGRTFTQSGESQILADGSFSTRFGTIYYYMTGTVKIADGITYTVK